MFYTFYFRSLWGSFVSGWALEAARLQRAGRAPFGAGNRIVWYTLASLGLCAIAFTAGGTIGLFAFVAQSVVAFSSLEIINYIEHYGLARREIAPGRYEPTRPKHSWNAGQRISNALLINLARHSDHHSTAEPSLSDFAHVRRRSRAAVAARLRDDVSHRPRSAAVVPHDERTRRRLERTRGSRVSAVAVGRRERKKLAARAAILDASSTLFIERGFDGTRIETIAQRADVGVGTVYNHFATKADILVAILFDDVGEVVARTREVVERGEPSAGAVLHDAIEELFTIMERRPRDLWRDLIAEAIGDRGALGIAYLNSERILRGRRASRARTFARNRLCKSPHRNRRCDRYRVRNGEDGRLCIRVRAGYRERAVARDSRTPDRCRVRLSYVYLATRSRAIISA